MPVPSEPFAAVYEDRNRLGVIVARIGGGGFEAYAADDHCLGLFPTPREAAAAITTTRPWACALPTAGADAEPRLKCLFLSKFVRAHQSRRRIVQRDESTVRQPPPIGSLVFERLAFVRRDVIPIRETACISKMLGFIFG
jgi:hypothetical protein